MEPAILGLIISFIMGNLIGSFLNVCIYRIPKGESVISPPSHCFKCGYNIKWYDNIPIVSYFILLRGKCRNCKEKISIQYPIIEIFTGIIFTIVYFRYDYSLFTLIMWLIASILIVLSIIDIREYILPDKLTFSLIIIGFIIAAIVGLDTLERSFLGAAAYAFPFWILYGFGETFLKKDIMGFGDVKLAAGIGAILHYTTFNRFWIFLTLAFVLGTIVSLLLIALKIKNRKDMVPFGPFIALAGFIMFLI